MGPLMLEMREKRRGFQLQIREEALILGLIINKREWEEIDTIPSSGVSPELIDVCIVLAHL